MIGKNSNGRTFLSIIAAADRIQVAFYSIPFHSFPFYSIAGRPDDCQSTPNPLDRLMVTDIVLNRFRPFRTFYHHFLRYSGTSALDLFTPFADSFQPAGRALHYLIPSLLPSSLVVGLFLHPFNSAKEIRCFDYSIEVMPSLMPARCCCRYRSPGSRIIGRHQHTAGPL